MYRWPRESRCTKGKGNILSRLDELESSHFSPLHPSDVLPEQSVQVSCPSASTISVVICHDESIFQTNDDQEFA